MRKRTGIGTVPELLQLEAWFGIDDQELLNDRYDKALEALASEDFEQWLADAARAGIVGDSAERFRQDWMGGRRVPMLASGDGKARLQQGFVDAITDARANGRKLSVVFALAGSEFDVDHCVGTNAVTVVIMVPTSATAAYQVQAD